MNDAPYKRKVNKNQRKYQYKKKRKSRAKQQQCQQLTENLLQMLRTYLPNVLSHIVGMVWGNVQKIWSLPHAEFTALPRFAPDVFVYQVNDCWEMWTRHNRGLAVHRLGIRYMVERNLNVWRQRNALPSLNRTKGQNI